MATVFSKVNEMSVQVIGLDYKVCMEWTEADTANLINANNLIECAKENCTLDEEIHYITLMDIVIAADDNLYVNYNVRNKDAAYYFNRWYHFIVTPGERRDFRKGD